MESACNDVVVVPRLGQAHSREACECRTSPLHRVALPWRHFADTLPRPFRLPSGAKSAVARMASVPAGGDSLGSETGAEAGCNNPAPKNVLSSPNCPAVQPSNHWEDHTELWLAWWLHVPPVSLHFF